MINKYRTFAMTWPNVGRSVLALLLLFSGEAPCFSDTVQQSKTLSDFTQFLQKLAEFSPDPCGPPYGREADWHSGDIESRLFQRAADIIANELNMEPNFPKSPKERVAEILTKLEQISAEINAAWPDEYRLHFEMLEILPAFIVKASIRTHDTFLVFGVPEMDQGKPDKLWHFIGSNTDYWAQETPYSHLDLYALNRGPSRRARFLARINGGGCAGSNGVAYDAREWNPEGMGSLDQIIKQTGSSGLGEVPGFAQIGKLQIQGAAITLPYCWFSPIDNWDNPSLCAIDTYDLSGDRVRFKDRTYNRPDLVPVAKAIEYAQQRDYPALLGYCASSQVASKLLQIIPPHVFAEDLLVTRRGKNRLHVELSYEPRYVFDVHEIAGRWQVRAFSVKY
jgi:hypothetical protein